MPSMLEKIEYARQSPRAMDDLLTEYLPFIRQEAGKQTTLGLEYDDRVSLGMSAFMRSVQQYDESRGSFVGYAATSIRHSLIDEAKRQGRYARNIVPLEAEGETEDESAVSFQQAAAQREYQRQVQGAALAEEIDILEEEMRGYGIRLENLVKLSPKHREACQQCAYAARVLADSEALARQLARTKRLPVSELAAASGVSPRTIAKFRKYIIAVSLIYMGDFSGIEGFLPKKEEQEP